MKKAGIIFRLLIFSFSLLPSLAHAQDSRKLPAMKKIDSTSERTDRQLGRKIQQKSLTAEPQKFSDSLNRKKKVHRKRRCS